MKPDSLINHPPAQVATPPPEPQDDGDAGEAKEQLAQKQLEERRAWREECTLDFEAYESSIVRIQLLHKSNERERERYATEKVKIQDMAQNIRDNTAELRIQLEAAQQTKARRLQWDEMADKITRNKALKPREDQLPLLQKLQEEIAELEQESRDYAHTWAERREQFGKIVEEGLQMLRLIRDEKEEAERKEGMEGHEDGEDGEGSTTRGDVSHVGTPRPDVDGMTPLHNAQEQDGTPPKSNLQHEMLAPSTASGRGSHRVSPARSPGPNGDSMHDADTQDAEATSRVAGNELEDDDDDEGEIEDGEAEDEENDDEEEEGETMDVT